MPCIEIIDSVKIFIYYNDHDPPHFHAIYAEFQELIEIETLKSYAGYIPGKQRKKVINWAKRNQELLLVIWDNFNPPGM